MTRRMAKTIDMCSLCGRPDFRSCGCPWQKPFSLWPHQLLAKVKSAVSGGPRKGS